MCARKFPTRTPVLLLVVLLISLFNVGVDGSRRRQAAQGYRLPDNIVPQKYNLEILTNLEENDFSFEGKLWIKVSIAKWFLGIILFISCRYHIRVPFQH